MLNLECCISARGERWPDPGSRSSSVPRRPPSTCSRLGVDCVTLANNHALDYGEGLLDTIDPFAPRASRRSERERRQEARRAGRARGGRLPPRGCRGHRPPARFAADERTPGVAYARWPRRPSWLGRGRVAAPRSRRRARHAALGPEHGGEPPGEDPRCSSGAARAGATVVAGHSAHVFHGIEGPVLYDLGDFVDDYATHPVLRNDLGLLFLLTLDAHGPVVWRRCRSSSTSAGPAWPTVRTRHGSGIASRTRAGSSARQWTSMTAV